jgi:hypothetical protein
MMLNKTLNTGVGTSVVDHGSSRCQDRRFTGVPECKLYRHSMWYDLTLLPCIRPA